MTTGQAVAKDVSAEQTTDTSFQTIEGVKPVEATEQKKNFEKPAFQVVEAKDHNRYLQINSELLRRFIFDQHDDQNIISRHHLYRDEDDEVTRIAKDRMSMFAVDMAVQHLCDWYDENRNRIFDALYERYECIITDVTKLGETLFQLRDELVQEATETMESGKATFSKLYFALRRPDTQLCISAGDVMVAGQIRSVNYEQGGFFSAPKLKLELTIYTHNGVALVPAVFNHSIPEFEGEIELSRLGIIKLTDEVKQTLIERGQKYVMFTEKPNYLAYTGNVTRRSYWNDLTFRANGRVMVDLNAMKSTDPNYSYYFAMDRDRQRKDNNAANKLKITSEVLMCTSPFVYGFSFSAKVWGEMLVENLTDIQFRDNAYDMLVLPQDIKGMLSALVESNSVVGKDFIDGKGGGCIFLLAGSPGVGKTLTAEAIAEKLRQPLYMVGIGELGTSVEELEKNLRDILDIAASWKAVLLLDEADIFMEKRDDVNIERNAMVGVFLRMLEYYQGTLFLTTNRAKSIDEAFYSRISLAIKYDDLDLAARRTIWTNILGLYGLPDVDAAVLAHHNINGRQIKNVTRIVTSLAEKEGIVPSTDDFIKVIDHVTKFNMS